MAQEYDSDQTVVRRRRQGSSWLLWLIGAAVLLALALLLIPFFNERDSAGPDTGATISEITSNPAQYYGKTVTVSGEVDRLLGQRGFTIGGQDFIGGNELLVVGAKPLPAVADRPNNAPLVADDVVQVTGPVRQFDLAAFEKEIGADLDDNLFSAYAGKPAIIAQSVDITPRAAGAALNPVPGDANITLADITRNPSAYFGRMATVHGNVDVIKNERAFTIASNTLTDANEVLVLTANNLILNTPLAEGELLQVRGTVRPFVKAEVEKELGLTLDPQLEVEFKGKPVIIATAIKPR
jgi:hypothetical protein